MVQMVEDFRRDCTAKRLCFCVLVCYKRMSTVGPTVPSFSGNLHRSFKFVFRFLSYTARLFCLSVDERKKL